MENTYRVAVLDNDNIVTTILIFSTLEEIDSLGFKYAVESEETKSAIIGKKWDGVEFEQNQSMPPAELVIE